MHYLIAFKHPLVQALPNAHPDIIYWQINAVVQVTNPKYDAVKKSNANQH